jgi:hypothetical protein
MNNRNNYMLSVADAKKESKNNQEEQKNRQDYTETAKMHQEADL